MIPVYSDQVNDSPYHAEFNAESNEVKIFENNVLLDTANVPDKPNFYDLETEEGIPYWKIATLHSKDVLATTVLQTCVRYRNRKTSCQFCAIEESLENDKTIAHKMPDQLAEVAKAAVELDGVTQMIMTTGTPKGTDRGASVLLESTRAVRAVVDIPIQVQCEPPAEDHWFQDLKDAGADALGMHLEAVSDRVRQDIMPGKATVPMSRYISAYKAAVKVFGVGNVSTYILAGLGDTEEEILTVSEELIELGVYPFVVPFVPIRGTPMEDHKPPSPEFMHSILAPLGQMLQKFELLSNDVKAGEFLV